MDKFLPKIGITIGDVAGIGPEIVLKTIAENDLMDFCLPIVIGDANSLKKTAEELNIAYNFVEIQNDSELPQTSLLPIIYDIKNINEEVILGKDSAQAGKASAEYIEKAVSLCTSKKIDAISTAPISKKSLNLGGYNFQGHTEFLAYLSNTKEFAMSFFAGKVRVVLLSTHLALREAIDLVKKDALVDLIRLTSREISKLLQRPVKIAVAGLNPHASEDGLFGNEEKNEIIPAVEECRVKYGIDVLGVFSADTIFLRALRGEIDAVICCYHDQATIAVKCLSFGESVNVTLGLPFIRTSVDHGTAFDIAGKNIADFKSIKTAIKLAAELSINKE